MTFLYIWIAVSAALCLLFKLNLFSATLVFFGVPLLYLLTKLKHVKTNVFIASFFFCVGFLAIIYYLAIQDNTWVVPSIFPIKIFGVISIEDYLFAYLEFCLILLFYRYTVKADEQKKEVNIVLIALVNLISLFAFVFIRILWPQTLIVPYFYFWGGLTFAFIPLVLFFLKNPPKIKPFFSIVPYFFVLSFIFELTALYLGHWSFPGSHYIGLISLWGMRFPVEELIFWMILSPPACLAWYSFFETN